MSKRLPEELESYEIDFDDIPSSVTTPYGQLISLKDSSGRFVDRIRLLRPGQSDYIVDFRDADLSHPVIEYLTRLSFALKARSTVSLTSIKQLFALLRRLPRAIPNKKGDFSLMLHEWVDGVFIDLGEKLSRDQSTALREFVELGVKLEVWGFDDSLLPAVSNVRPSKGRSELDLELLLDPDEGPYSKSQIAQISNLLNDDSSLPIAYKCILKISMEFGIRPIQTILIRTTDFYYLDGVPVLRIYGVKGPFKSRLRYHPHNYSEFEIPDQLADLLKEQVESAKTQSVAVRQKFPQQFSKLLPDEDPLFPTDMVSERAIRYCKSGLAEFALHRTSSYVVGAFQRITAAAKIPNPHGQRRFAKLCATRFRRTKAVSMVLSGFSPEEVAAALGHEKVDTISHYFRFCREVVTHLEAASTRSVEINAMSIAWASDATQGVGVLTPMKLPIGLCTFPGVCPYQPGLSCYGCVKFRAFRDGPHAQAAKDMESLKSRVATSSTGPLASELDYPITVAKTLAKEQEEQEEQGEGQEQDEPESNPGDDDGQSDF